MLSRFQLNALPQAMLEYQRLFLLPFDPTKRFLNTVQLQFSRACVITSGFSTACKGYLHIASACSCPAWVWPAQDKDTFVFAVLFSAARRSVAASSVPTAGTAACWTTSASPSPLVHAAQLCNPVAWPALLWAAWWCARCFISSSKSAAVQHGPPLPSS